MFKLRLVSDIPAHLKRHTIRGLAAIAALQPVWLAIDSSIKGGLPLWLTLTINSAIAVAVLGLGFVQQPITPQAFFNSPHDAARQSATDLVALLDTRRLALSEPGMFSERSMERLEKDIQIATDKLYALAEPEDVREDSQ